jgi:hypothetical protein
MTSSASSAPFCTVDLGANGGLFAPLSLDHAEEWVQSELRFWKQFNVTVNVEELHTGVQRRKERKVVHSRWAVAFGVTFVLLLIGGGFWLHFETSKMLFLLEPGKSPNAWMLGRVAIFGVLAIWALRIIVKLLLSNLHIANDAAERAVMTETYLSLMESDKLPNVEDRQLILNALFRHSADGIVKDEGLPQGVFEYLTRVGKP